MYTVTFYSYKGGVGRTMALMNVGLELAQSGRRVLLVDFDLEAPSLQTFNLPMPPKPSLGIVDYITHYLATDEAPDVEEYVYSSPGMSEWGDRLWIMPAGKQDGKYGQRFSAIDWQRLYAERDGYLLFEDLKAQWKRHVAPDYVLIDSRTGHNEEGGICTRQLPDAVTILFFPNEQNLSGLKKVVSDIRNEATGPRKKDIQLHFVNSNVPDLDDEDRILATRIQEFQDALGFNASASIVIHHYNSLALLNQDIFTRTRPRSRLAGEYRELVKAISRYNLEDREGALDYLNNMFRRTSRMAIISTTTPKELDDRLDNIRTFHGRDGEILYRLADIRYRQGRLEEALILINEAVDTGYRSPEVLLRRAELYRFQENPQPALDDVQKVLNSNEATYFNVSLAVRMLQDLDSEGLKRIPDSPALTALDFDERLAIAHELLTSYDSLLAAEAILSSLVRDRDASAVQHKRATVELSLCLIGLGQFREAMHTISPTRPELGAFDISDTFNYAMAEWGETGILPRDLFQYIIDLDRQNPHSNMANYSQCLAIAHWAVGDIEQARDKISLARQRIMTRRRPEFSAWRYLTVSVDQFISDLNAMLEMINGKNILVPMFMAKDTQNDNKGGSS